MKASVCLIQPPGYRHSLGLLEVCQLLVGSFESLGWRCALRTNSVESGRLNVVVGYQLLRPRDAAQLTRADCVFYQLEQLSALQGWYSADREAVLRSGLAVWDYSPQNVDFLRRRGFSQVSLLPLGFHPVLRRIHPWPEERKDIDVLFYGSENKRRNAVLERLRSQCRVQSLFGVYGAERDQWIARSRVVLNVHFYETQILEQVRLSYLLNNECFVISEDSSPNPYAESIVCGSYEELESLCLRYIADPRARAEQAARGARWHERRRMTEFLGAALEETFQGCSVPCGASRVEVKG